MDTKSLFDELQKLGAVDPEEARRALDKLDTLEKTKADPAQVARYSALGAVAGPTAGAVGDIISGTKPFGMGAGGGVKGVLRNIAAQSAKGAIGLGAVPLVRHALDRKAEMGTLQQYMRENAPEPDNGISHKTAFIGVGIDVASFAEDKEHKGVINIGFPHVVSAQLRHKPTGMGAGIGMAGPLISWSPGTMSEYRREHEKAKKKTAEAWGKLAATGVGAPMTVSEYSGPMGYGAFPLVSHQGSKPPNSLRAPVTKLGQFELTGYGDPGEGPRPNRLVSHQGGSPVPGLRGVLEKKGSIRFPSGSTPAGRLASGQRIGLPKVTAPSGPSIAEVSKPQGFGTSMPGAHKIGI